VTEETEVGVSITAFTSSPQDVEDEKTVLIETDLNALDAESVKWSVYDRAYQIYEDDPTLRFPPLTALSLDVRVTIDDRRRRKSIEALLKPCIDGLEPILGHPDNVLPQPREQLKRNLAPQDEMILSLNFHVQGGSSNRIVARISPG
jgi:hypothetical protein